MATALIAAEEFRSVPVIAYSYRIGHKRPDWRANDYRRFRDLIKALTDLASIAASHGLMKLMEIARNEYDAHMNRVVRPDRKMIEACKTEIDKLDVTLKLLGNPSKNGSGKHKFKRHRADNISLIKLLLPYSVLSRYVERRYGFKWPSAKKFSLLPFCIAAALVQKGNGDRRILKYLLPYGFMCKHMLWEYGARSWHGIALDDAKMLRLSGRKRKWLPFGTILFLDANSRRKKR